MSDLGATVIMGRRPLESARTDQADASRLAEASRVEAGVRARVEDEAAASQVQPRPSAKVWLIAALAVLLLAGIGIAYRVASHTENIAVTVSPQPQDSAIAIDGVPCPNPCQRQLPEGEHTVSAQHDGYVSVHQSIQVKRGASPNFPLNLLPSPAPEANSARSSGGEITPAKPVETKPSASDRNARSPSTAKVAPPDTKVQPASPSLQPGPGVPVKVVASVVLSKLPPGARVKVESGETHQADGSGVARFDLPAGNHTLEITAEGYSPRTIQGAFSSGENALNGAMELDPEQREWARIESGNDSGALQSFLKNYPASKHADAAKAKLEKLNSSTPPPANVARGSSSLTDGDMISDTLGRFGVAYSSKDADGVCAIWPGCPRKELKGVFRDALSITMKLTPSAPPQISGDTASVACSRERMTTYKGTPPRPGRDTVTIRLRKQSGKWLIESIN